VSKKKEKLYDENGKYVVKMASINERRAGSEKRKRKAVGGNAL